MLMSGAATPGPKRNTLRRNLIAVYFVEVSEGHGITEGCLPGTAELPGPLPSANTTLGAHHDAVRYTQPVTPGHVATKMVGVGTGQMLGCVSSTSGPHMGSPQYDSG